MVLTPSLRNAEARCVSTVLTLMRRIGQIYDGEVDRVITRFTSLLEPIMIVVMGVIVLFIVVAILLPIFEMGQMVK